MKSLASRMDKRIRIERPAEIGSFTGAGQGDWQLVVEVAAEVQDMLPSRGERLAEGLSIAARPARVRIRYYSGVAANMRVLIGCNAKGGDGLLSWRTDRTAAIVTVPAELGRREGLEFMIADYSTDGTGS